MYAGGRKDRGILGECEVSSLRGQLRDGERVGAGIRAVVRFDYGVCDQRDESGMRIDADRGQIALSGSQHDPPRASSGWRSQVDRRIDIEPDTTWRKRDAGLYIDLAAGNGGMQAPADTAQADGAAEVAHAFPQAVLQMLEMIGGNSQSVEKLRSCIIGHGSLLLRLQ